MREKIEKIKRNALILLKALPVLVYAYIPGSLVGAGGWFGRKCTAIKVIHSERLACIRTLRKKIIVCNHPSWFDPFLAAALIAWYYLTNPFRDAPMIVADQEKFYDSWLLWFFKPVMIPIDRNNKERTFAALRKMEEAVNSGRPLIIFPEGGRTFKGEDDKFHRSVNGSRIRFLEEGIGFLVRRTGATVIPIGLDGSDRVFPPSKKRLLTRPKPWHRIVISVGDPIVFKPHTPRGHITQEIAFQLLRLMDETKVYK